MNTTTFDRRSPLDGNEISEEKAKLSNDNTNKEWTSNEETASPAPVSEEDKEAEEAELTVDSPSVKEETVLSMEAGEEKETTNESNDEDEEESPEEKTKEQKKTPFVSTVLDMVQLVAVSLSIVMLILTVFMRHSPVYGSSMYPTIHGREEYLSDERNGKDVLLISNLFYTPKKGDIVVLQTPNVKGNTEASMSHPIVKRIIATGKDRVTIDFEKWMIKINGEITEAGVGGASYVNYTEGMMSGFSVAMMDYLTRHPECDFEKNGTEYSFTVPEGHIFVLGDNRNNSLDSRALGFMDERWIVGRSLFRIFPFDRLGKVD